jgi:hypothetical protein
MTEVSDDRVIKAKITRAGLRALFNAQNNGLSLKLTHIAVGSGGLINGVAGYTPTGNEIALTAEFARVAIGGGEYLADFEILVQAMFDGPAQGWVHELGVFTDTGVLFAIWSEKDAPLLFKTNGVPVITAMTLAVSEIPPDSLTVVVGAPSVNIVMAGPFATLSAEIIRGHRLGITAELNRIEPIIKNTWR